MWFCEVRVPEQSPRPIPCAGDKRVPEATTARGFSDFRGTADGSGFRPWASGHGDGSATQFPHRSVCEGLGSKVAAN